MTKKLAKIEKLVRLRREFVTSMLCWPAGNYFSRDRLLERLITLTYQCNCSIGVQKIREFHFSSFGYRAWTLEGTVRNEFGADDYYRFGVSERLVAFPFADEFHIIPLDDS